MNDTVLDSGLALEETVAGSPKLEVGPVSAVTPIRTTLRTTVLPRVRTVGAEAHIVVEDRARYEHVNRLGEGGIGEVLGVVDNDIGRKVAVKRLRANVKSPAAALRFAEEVRTVGQLEHPNIIPIHDVGVDEKGDYFFVMKYVDGETLESVIEKLIAGDKDYHARFGFEHRVQIFSALLEAVAFAHSKGIIHRDIKPANVMIGPYGEVVLMDWGIAKNTGAKVAPESAPEAGVTQQTSRRGTLFETRIGELVGTPAYASPEQARGDKIDERSDIYSLSLLFWEFLTLRHPLESKQSLIEMLRAIQDEPVPHASFVKSPHQPIVPVELGWFLIHGLAKDPAKRFPSVRFMIEGLGRRAEGYFPIQCPITFSKRVLNIAKRFVDRHPLATTLLLVGGTLGVISESVLLAIHALH